MKFKKILSLIALLGLLLLLFCPYKTGFSPQKISPSLYSPKVGLKEELTEPILNQPFFYLGKGAQTYAFISKDNRYVLKFFRSYSTYRLGHKLLDILPFFKKKFKFYKPFKKRKLSRNFSSYELASQEMAKETGLILLHLHQTKSLPQVVLLYDENNKVHKVPINDLAFVLQKKANLVYPSLEKWLEENLYEQAALSLSKLISLLRNRYAKNIFDKDPNLRTNFGFVGNEPIQFDPGDYQKVASTSASASLEEVPVTDSSSAELSYIFNPLCIWLDQKAPELATYVRELIQENS